MKYLLSIFRLALLAIPVTVAVHPLSTSAQAPAASETASLTYSGAHGVLERTDSFFSSDTADMASSSSSEASLPSAPEPASGGGGFDHYAAAPAAYWHQQPFSRIGIGANVSPLGFSLQSAINLNHYFDARVMGNYFSYADANFDIEGFNVTGNFHFASAAASLDWYPFGSIFRLSPGVMFYNGNQVTATGGVAGGTDISIDNRTYYSAKTNPVTGASPLTGTGKLGLNTHNPALTVAGGFGSFIPRSNRHWSFPSEFGVVFMGAPTINLNLSGWACTDKAETSCSNIGDPTNPIAIQFNKDLQSSIQKWRKDVSVVKVYPIFSYSVVYSFNIR